MSDAIDAANQLLREKGYAERDLAVHAGPRGRALLKGNKIISPLSDEADVVLRVARELGRPTPSWAGRSSARLTCAARLGTS